MLHGEGRAFDENWLREAQAETGVLLPDRPECPAIYPWLVDTFDLFTRLSLGRQAAFGALQPLPLSEIARFASSPDEVYLIQALDRALLLSVNKEAKQSDPGPQS